MVLSDRIWNYRDNFENRDGEWCILTACETIWNYRDNFENKDAKWCISTVFETIWNCREKKKKKKTVNCDFIRYLKRF